jgi:glutathione S-transferase
VAELLGLPYSPWSEKARWPLDARRVPYKNVTYAPWVGEPLLRM